MLGKLIKYEFQSILRIVIPISIVFMAMTGFTFLAYSFSMKDSILIVIPGLCTFLYIITIILLLASALLFTIYRFYKNLITNEGYLMFTLPVKADKLVQAKLVTAITTQVITFGLCILSLFLIGKAKYSMLKFTGLSEEIERIQNILQVNTPMFLFLLIIIALLTLLSNNLTFYASIAFGHTLTKNKLIGSAIGYFIIYVIGQGISGAIILILYLLSHGDINPWGVIALILAALAACSAILYYVTNKYLSNKLNLD